MVGCVSGLGLTGSFDLQSIGGSVTFKDMNFEHTGCQILG